MLDCLYHTSISDTEEWRWSPPDLVEGGQQPGLLAGEAVASLDGGDGALHVAGHQQLRELQQTVAEHE